MIAQRSHESGGLLGLVCGVSRACGRFGHCAIWPVVIFLVELNAVRFDWVDSGTQVSRRRPHTCELSHNGFEDAEEAGDVRFLPGVGFESDC